MVTPAVCGFKCLGEYRIITEAKNGRIEWSHPLSVVLNAWVNTELLQKLKLVPAGTSSETTRR